MKVEEKERVGAVGREHQLLELQREVVQKGRSYS